MHLPRRLLGSGAHGQVLLARHLASGELVAIKILNNGGGGAQGGASSTTATAAAAVNGGGSGREVSALQALHHPHVVRLYDVVTLPQHTCLVLEYLPGGELFDYLVARHRLLERQAVPFVRQVCVAAFGFFFVLLGVSVFW